MRWRTRIEWVVGRKRETLQSIAREVGPLCHPNTKTNLAPLTTADIRSFGLFLIMAIGFWALSVAVQEHWSPLDRAQSDRAVYSSGLNAGERRL